MRPIARRLGVPDRLDRISMLLDARWPPPVSGSMLGGIGPAELETKQIAEEVVVAEPGPRHVDRDDESVCILEALQIPLRSRAPVRKSASGPLTRSRIDVWSSRSRTSGGWRSSTSASR